MQAPFPPGKGAFRLNGRLRREECRNTAGRAEHLNRSSGAEHLETFRRAEHLKTSGRKSVRPCLLFQTALRPEGACRLHKGRGRQGMRRSVTAPERRPENGGKAAPRPKRRAPFSSVSGVRKTRVFPWGTLRLLCGVVGVSCPATAAGMSVPSCGSVGRGPPLPSGRQPHISHSERPVLKVLFRGTVSFPSGDRMPQEGRRKNPAERSRRICRVWLRMRQAGRSAHEKGPRP